MTAILNKITPVRTTTGAFTVDGNWSIEIIGGTFQLTNNFNVDELEQVTCICTLFDIQVDTINGQFVSFINGMYHDFISVVPSVYPVFVKDNIIHAWGADLKHYQFDMDGLQIDSLDWITAPAVLVYASTNLAPDFYNVGFLNIDQKVGLFLHCEYRGLRIAVPTTVVRMVVNTSPIDAGYLESFDYLDNFFIDGPNYGSLGYLANLSSSGASFTYFLSPVVLGDNLLICYFGYYGFSNRIDLDEEYTNPLPDGLYDGIFPSYNPTNAFVAAYGNNANSGGALADYAQGIAFAGATFAANQSDVEYSNHGIQISYAGNPLVDYSYVNVLGESDLVESFIAYSLNGEFIFFSEDYQPAQILLADTNIGVLVLDELGNPYFLSTGEIEPDTAVKKSPRWFPVSNYSRLI
jgi:hypothetical protein